MNYDFLVCINLGDALDGFEFKEWTKSLFE